MADRTRAVTAWRSLVFGRTLRLRRILELRDVLALVFVRRRRTLGLGRVLLGRSARTVVPPGPTSTLGALVGVVHGRSPRHHRYRAGESTRASGERGAQEPRQVRIPPSIERIIRMRAAAAYPGECCGALLGVDGAGVREGVRRIVEAVAVENADSADRHDRFRIPADDVCRIERRAARHGCTLVGFYHTHPNRPAVPSSRDAEFAWPWYTHLIVPVAAGRPGAARAWRLAPDRGRFAEERVVSGGGEVRGDSSKLDVVCGRNPADAACHVNDEEHP